MDVSYFLGLLREVGAQEGREKNSSGTLIQLFLTTNHTRSNFSCSVGGNMKHENLRSQLCFYSVPLPGMPSPWVFAARPGSHFPWLRRDHRGCREHCGPSLLLLTDRESQAPCERPRTHDLISLPRQETLFPFCTRSRCPVMQRHTARMQDPLLLTPEFCLRLHAFLRRPRPTETPVLRFSLSRKETFSPCDPALAHTQKRFPVSSEHHHCY